MTEKFSNWPLLIETNALSLAVAAIASLSPKASVAFQQKPYGLDCARRKRVCDFIKGNMHRQITLAEMAEVAGMSQFHFTRLFKSKTGMSPLAYVAQKRIELTKTALRSSGATLAQVAIDCGYASQSHLTTAFKAVTGMTPGQYRKSVSAS
jgi:AraC family transcriptional regulator